MIDRQTFGQMKYYSTRTLHACKKKPLGMAFSRVNEHLEWKTHFRVGEPSKYTVVPGVRDRRHFLYTVVVWRVSAINSVFTVSDNNTTNTQGGGDDVIISFVPTTAMYINRYSSDPKPLF